MRIEDQPPATQESAKQKTLNRRLVICVRNLDYAASVELRKSTGVIPDPAAESHWMVRARDVGRKLSVSETCFVTVDLPVPVARDRRG